jgi:hypothetical protein
LFNFGIVIDKQFDRLHKDLWTIQIEQDNDNVKATNSEIEFENEKCDDIFTFFVSSKVLAYNNNTLDKMILAHAYQQKFSEVPINFKI